VVISQAARCRVALGNEDGADRAAAYADLGEVAVVTAADGAADLDVLGRGEKFGEAPECLSRLRGSAGHAARPPCSGMS